MRIPIVVLCALLLWNPGSATPDEEGSLRIVVRDRVTDARLADAAVRITAREGTLERQGRTDRWGVAVFSGKPGDGVVVGVEKEGYQSFTSDSVVRFGNWRTRTITVHVAADNLACFTRVPLISLDDTAHVTRFSREFLDDLPLRATPGR